MVRDPSGKLSAAYQHEGRCPSISDGFLCHHHRCLREGETPNFGQLLAPRSGFGDAAVRDVARGAETNDGRDPYVSWGSQPLDLSSALCLNLERPIALHKVPEWLSHIDMTPAKDMMEHWSHSESAVHPLSQAPHVDPGVGTDDVSQFRVRVLRGVSDLIKAMEPETSIPATSHSQGLHAGW